MWLTFTQIEVFLSIWSTFPQTVPYPLLLEFLWFPFVEDMSYVIFDLENVLSNDSHFGKTRISKASVELHKTFPSQMSIMALKFFP